MLYLNFVSLAAGTKLVFTDEVIAIVVGVGADCYRSKLGGSSYVAIRKRRRVVVEVILDHLCSCAQSTHIDASLFCAFLGC